MWQCGFGDKVSAPRSCWRLPSLLLGVLTQSKELLQRRAAGYKICHIERLDTGQHGHHCQPSSGQHRKTVMLKDDYVDPSTWAC